MKTIRLFLICSLLSFGNIVFSQNTVLPDADIYTLDGLRVNSSDITGNNMYTVILFWNMNDPKSVEQLLSMNDLNDDSADGKTVKIIAVCTDLSGYMQSIKPFVNGNAIDIDVYVDKNNDLKRLMGVPETPYTVLFDKEKNKQATVMGSGVNINTLIDGVTKDHLAEGK
jgi:hypothetical protein